MVVLTKGGVFLFGGGSHKELGVEVMAQIFTRTHGIDMLNYNCLVFQSPFDLTALSCCFCLNFSSFHFSHCESKGSLLLVSALS